MPGTIRHFPSSVQACAGGLTVVVYDAPDVKLLPDLLVEDAGSIYDKGQQVRALDITRICTIHQWASLRVPLESGVEPPACELCRAELLAIEGYARYRDLLANREAGLI